MTGERFVDSPWAYVAGWLAGIPTGMLAGLDFGASVLMGWFVLMVVAAPLALVWGMAAAAVERYRANRRAKV